jgi:predicted transglutaminase-like cysteine proteinase
MPVVILNQVTWAQLEQVQQQVNEKVRFESDMAKYGLDEYWETADDTGDCEDIALAKRKMLLDQGWPAEALRMATAVDEQGQLHAVLTVDVTYAHGRRGTYVLDNRFNHVEPWQVLSEYGYAWVERMNATGRGWTSLRANQGA